MRKFKLFYLSAAACLLPAAVMANDAEFNEQNSSCKGMLLEMECVDLNGKPITGVRKIYYENGQLYEKGEFVNGKYEGHINIYYENGAPHFKMTIKNGGFDGFFKSWYENGQMKYENNFENGKPNGFHRTYYENGLTEVESKYNHGDVEYHDIYYDNGILYHHCTTKNKVADVALYCTHGMLMITYSVKDGKILKQKNHRPDNDPCLIATLERRNAEKANGEK